MAAPQRKPSGKGRSHRAISSRDGAGAATFGASAPPTTWCEQGLGVVDGAAAPGDVLVRADQHQVGLDSGRPELRQVDEVAHPQRDAGGGRGVGEAVR